jgi:hypothetical protein
MCCFLAPNADDPDQLDMAMVRGHLGLRRLRPVDGFPIFRMRQWSEAGQAVGTQRWEPIEVGSRPGPALVSTRAMSPRSSGRDGGRHGLRHQPGPIGNRGAFDCFYGDMLRAGASRYRTDDDITGEFGATITVPRRTWSST